LVKTAAPSLSESLASIPYASSAIVNLAFRRSDIEHPLNGMGFVVPAAENRSIIGCTFSSVKLAGRAPEDYALLRAYVGGAGSKGEAYFNRSESEIVESVIKELHELLGLRGDPQLALVYKHPNAMAQYHLGHLDLVAEIEAQARKLPGFALAGNAYRGIGIPDCINSGEQAASLLLEHGLG
jgi:oxygen-dependent protoporphyrinogen oxidase